MQSKIGKLRDIGKTFRAAVSVITELAPGENGAKQYRRAAMALYKTVLAGPGRLTARDLQEVRDLLRSLPPAELDELIAMLHSAEVITVDELATGLSGLPGPEQHRLLESAIKLAVRSNRLEINHAYLAGIAERLHYGAAAFEAKIVELKMQEGNRRNLIRSGAGILAALLVLLVFIVTATLLKSVIFGLILAYVVLPLEKYFYRRLGDPHSLLHLLSRGGRKITAPFHRLTAAIRRQPPLSPEEEEKNAQNRRITRAVSLAAVSFFAIAAVLLVVFTLLVGNYVSTLKTRTAMRRQMVAEAPAVPVRDPAGPAGGTAVPLPKPVTTLLQSVQHGLDQLRIKFDRMPLVQYGVDAIENMLHDQATQEKLLSFLLKRSSGMVSVTTGILAGICALLADLLLTVFFFLLFLHGMARFCASHPGSNRQNEYLVRTVLNGNWLPGVREETVAEAVRIISEIINKLKVWVRGYLTLMLVDGTVYTTLFYFLKVPYFFILGPLAGCGILLPYIGPILSAVFTVLVTLAVGSADVPTSQIIGIICCYLVYNGIIEQFILYPLVIGEAIGLTTLETIIVVLLGAIFAGIPGMILALPAASVLKYLVPQIYHCFDQSDGANARKPIE